MDIKGYRIEKVIGRGGMATVYLATQTTLERHVALKVMNPAFANDQDFTTRFLQEGPIAAKLNDPQIVTVFDSGVDHEHYYLAMEYLPGGTLKQKIREGLPIEKTLNIIKLIAKGLAYAHSQGVLHRDIKPQNILFRASGEPVLTDFGIAKALSGTSHLTVPGTAFGSPKYMSPEQAKGLPLDQRTDVYSLGVVFYEMLSGRPPFEATDAISLAQMHITEPVPPIPAQYVLFQPLFDSLLAKDPAARLQSVEQFLADLKKVRQQYFIETNLGGTQPKLDMTDITQVKSLARPPRSAQKTSTTIPPATRSGLPKLLVGLAVLALALIGGGYIYLDYVPKQTASSKPPTTNQSPPASQTNLANNAAVEKALATATQLQQQGEFEQGLQTVRAALAIAPNHPRLLLLEAELENAQAAAQQAATSTSETTDASEPTTTPVITEISASERLIADTLAQVQRLRQQGQLEQSLTIVQNALSTLPQNPDLLGLQQELESTIADLEKRRQAAAYLATAQKALQQNNLDNSRAAVLQGLALMPDDKELLVLQNQINTKQAALKHEQQALELYQQATQHFEQQQLQRALETTQQGLTLAPQDEKLLALRQKILASQQQLVMEQQLREQIEQLLAQAQTQLDELQLTTPPGANAHETYQQVLAQDPENAAALQGLRSIAAKYAELAERALQAGENDKTLDYIQRGLNVVSDDPRLLALQDQLKKNQTAQKQLALARQYLVAKQLEDGLNAIEMGLIALPNQPELQALRSEVLQQLDLREKQLIATTALSEAQELRRQNQLDQAKAVLTRALNEVPDNSAMTALYQQLEDEQTLLKKQAAIAETLAIAQQLLDRSELSAAYTQLQQGLQQYPNNAALLALEKQIQQRQTLITLFEKAKDFIQQGALDDARSLVQRGLEIYPAEPQLLALNQQIERELQAQQAAATAATTAQTSSQDSSDSASPVDVLTLSQGLATLAKQAGLDNIEGFLRERANTLTQDTTEPTIENSTPNTDDTATGDIAVTRESLPDPSAETVTNDSDLALASDTTQTATEQQTDPAVDPREQQIATLLTAAEQYFNELNLTTPRGNNAYDVYREVLQLDPTNSAARRGLQAIVNRYQSWAQNQRERGNFQRSLSHIEKALRVDPDNRELLALRQTVQAQQESAQKPQSPGQNPQPSGTADPCDVDRGSKECWCKTLKMFCN